MDVNTEFSFMSIANCHWSWSKSLHLWQC